VAHRAGRHKLTEAAQQGGSNDRESDTGFRYCGYHNPACCDENWAVVTIRSAPVRSEASFNGDVLPMSRNRAVADTFDPEQTISRHIFLRSRGSSCAALYATKVPVAPIANLSISRNVTGKLTSQRRTKPLAASHGSERHALSGANPDRVHLVGALDDGCVGMRGLRDYAASRHEQPEVAAMAATRLGRHR